MNRYLRTVDTKKERDLTNYDRLLCELLEYLHEKDMKYIRSNSH